MQMIIYFYHFHNVNAGDILRIAGVYEHIVHISNYTMRVDGSAYYSINYATDVKTLNSVMKRRRINIVLTWD